MAPTSRNARARVVRPEIEIDGEPTRVLIEQFGAVDASRLGDCVSHLTREQIWGVDESLRIVPALR